MVMQQRICPQSLRSCPEGRARPFDRLRTGLRRPGVRPKNKPRLTGACSMRQGRLQRLDAHRLAVARALDGVAHFAVDQCEQRVVLADADIAAGMELGAALANDDRAGRDGLAAEHLDAEHFRLGITAVPRGTAAFFLCHGSDLLEVAYQAFTALISISVKFWR